MVVEQVRLPVGDAGEVSLLGDSLFPGASGKLSDTG